MAGSEIQSGRKDFDRKSRLFVGTERLFGSATRLAGARTTVAVIAERVYTPSDIPEPTLALFGPTRRRCDGDPRADHFFFDSFLTASRVNTCSEPLRAWDSRTGSFVMTIW
jgi:hypothetical protein